MLLPVLLIAAPIVAQDQGGANLIDRGRIDRAPKTLTPLGKPVPKPKTRHSFGRANHQITGIQFKGARAPGPVGEAAKTFLGKLATSDTLTDLAAALSEAYARVRRALYDRRSEQDFHDGLVVILLTEGSIAKAQLKTTIPPAATTC